MSTSDPVSTAPVLTTVQSQVTGAQPGVTTTVGHGGFTLEEVRRQLKGETDKIIARVLELESEVEERKKKEEEMMLQVTQLRDELKMRDGGRDEEILKAESERKKAEEERKTAEGIRKKAEEDRQRAEEEREERMNAQEGSVRQWKRRACNILGVVAPPGYAPPTTTPATTPYDCFDTNCTYKQKKFRLDTYIQHIRVKHNFNIRSERHNQQERDKYLPRRSC